MRIDAQIDTVGCRRYIARLVRGGRPRVPFLAQVAELVDALVSGTSGAIRGGSSPLLGTISPIRRTRIVAHSPPIEAAEPNASRRSALRVWRDTGLCPACRAHTSPPRVRYRLPS